jgi:transcriptional regulator with XRE-family HTH domain
MNVKSSEKTAATEAPTFGARLRARREELGLTQKGLARKSGVGANQISEYERDQHHPRKENLRLLFQVLGRRWAERDPSPGLEGAEAAGDRSLWSILARALARLVGSQTRLIVAWMDEEGLPAVIAEGPDSRLLAIRARIGPASAVDVRPLRNLVDGLLQRVTS